MATEQLNRNSINTRLLNGDSVAIPVGPNPILRAALRRACSLTRESPRNAGMIGTARLSAHIAIGHFASDCRARGTPPKKTIIEFRRVIEELTPDLNGDPVFADYCELRGLADDMIRWCIEEYFAGTSTSASPAAGAHTGAEDASENTIAGGGWPMHCPVCTLDQATIEGSGAIRDARDVECPRCGEFSVSGDETLDLATYSQAERDALSSELHNASLAGKPLYLSMGLGRRVLECGWRLGRTIPGIRRPTPHRA
jgi:hypothetical protein